MLPLCAGERDRVRPVRAALRRLADRQVPARRAVPGRLADDAAPRAVRAARRRTASSTALDRLREEADARGVVDGRRSRSPGCSQPRRHRRGVRAEPRRAHSIRSSSRARLVTLACRPRPHRLVLPMTVRVLDEHDVRQLLPMGECIDVMADALASLARGEVHNPLRFVVRPPGEASLMGLMPAHRGGDRAALGAQDGRDLPRQQRARPRLAPGLRRALRRRDGRDARAAERRRDHRGPHRRRLRCRDAAARA